MALTMRNALASQPDLTLLYTGKVRELYAINDEPEQLVFVATNRVSAYDVVLATDIPFKGAILTQLSRFWFDFLKTKLPNVKTHFISPGLPKNLVGDVRADVRRSMVVRKLEMLPLESICRGYISGSAWASYSRDGTVNGIPLPAGLRESDKLLEVLWTPSTKASEPGEHDENISPARAAEVVGADVAQKVEEISKLVYQAGSEYARERGIIIADTKFELYVSTSLRTEYKFSNTSTVLSTTRSTHQKSCFVMRS